MTIIPNKMRFGNNGVKSAHLSLQGISLWQE